MTPGTSEAQAAAGFLAQHGSLFGGTFTDHEPEVRQLWSVTAKDESFTSFAYRQLIRGREVEGSDIRIKVKGGTIARVDYAAARIAGEPTAGSENPYLTAEAASLFVRMWSGIENLVVQGTPEEVVLRGEGQRPDAWCWRVNARIGENASAAYRTYFVDTAMPRVMYVQNNEFNCAAPRNIDPPTTGTVTGYGTSMAAPYRPYQGSGSTLVLHPIPGIKVYATDVDAATNTDDAGSFSFSPSVSLTGVSTRFGDVSDQSEWYYFFTFASPSAELLSASSSVSPGGHVDLELGNSGLTPEERVAQVNAIVGAKRAMDFFANYIGDSLPRFSLVMRLNPNNSSNLSPGGCGGMTFNQFVTPNRFEMRLGRSFSNASGAMWNCASASVTAHEYGHAALFVLELSLGGNGAFHEGFGDVYASMLNDDAVFGREHNQDDSPIREDPTSSSINCQYPIACHTTTLCECEHSHSAGQLLSGPWVRIREGLKLEYGYTDGLEAARVLFTKWSIMTIGGSYCDSAHAGTFAEVLSLAKDEGQEIVITNAFHAHNIVLEDDVGCP